MLRIHRAKAQRHSADLRIDYHDPYLALTSLLVDAATLEHSLMAMYLYALFSLKDQYAAVRGTLSARAFQPQPPGLPSAAAPAVPTFLDITIEEMQHLALVNQLLYELSAAPCLERHTFPYLFEIYPFPLQLRSLDRYSAATFMWIEASSTQLNRDAPADRRESSELISEVENAIDAKPGEGRVARFRRKKLEHIGSLYGKILECLDVLRAQPPAFLAPTFPWGVWADRIDWLRNQGEIKHYRFFRSLFSGEAFGSGPEIWRDRRSKDYPSLSLPWRTAFASRKHNLARRTRSLAWLANLIYWCLLCLLDVSYRSNNRKLIYVAIEHMASALWWLGLTLAHQHRVGMPFDVMLVRYNLGRNDAATLAIITRLVREARRQAEQLAAEGLLPEAFDLGLFERTLAAIGEP
jgi:hypothetical protein